MQKLRLKKNFWTKMIAMNCAFIFGVIILFTVLRYNTSITAERKNVQDLLMQVAEADTSQLKQMLDEMSRLSLNIAVSNITREVLKEAVNYEGSNNFFDDNRDERRELIQAMQQMAGTNIQDSSINIVSAKGDYVLLDVYSSLSMNREEMQEKSKMEEFEGEKEYKFIDGIEEDYFGRTEDLMFSYVRKISDEFRDYGYVEVQKSKNSLDAIFENTSDNFGIVSIVTKQGEVFYASDSREEHWENYAEDLKEHGTVMENTGFRTGTETYLLYTTELNDYGFSVYTIIPESYYIQRVIQETMLLLVQSVILLIATLILILLISRQVYRPVRILREKMEHIELDNIKPEPELSKDADEIELFNHVFANMVERIRRQNDELLQQKIREFEVAYQALKAQVSPHFLYNTLYLIGLKGEEHDAPEILDMCSYLTHMMAYCVDMKNDIVPMSSEIEYMENYLQLMKYRYLEKLNYELEIGEEVRALLVPKFILQPLVENCFTHGFKNCGAKQFRIMVAIQQIEDAWTIRIEDNGNGFSAEDRERTEKEIAFVRQSIQNPDAKFVHEITGVGLINTYARLLINFKGQVSLEIGDSTLGGGLVEITCWIRRT